MVESMVGHTPSSENVADLMTKLLYGQGRKYLVINILYDINDDHWAPMIHLFRTIMGKFDPIYNSFNLEGNGKVHS